jgi:hypothetical protein
MVPTLSKGVLRIRVSETGMIKIKKSVVLQYFCVDPKRPILNFIQSKIIQFLSI